ncbi:hypothetical protein EON81_06720 [bacterium]|nr:MAG: hypothetical protein EON81_06720 [bacterium]
MLSSYFSFILLSCVLTGPRGATDAFGKSLVRIYFFARETARDGNTRLRGSACSTQTSLMRSGVKGHSSLYEPITHKMSYYFPMAFRGDLDALVLGILQSDELHGYEIGNRIRQRSDETVSVADGMLYPALRRLEAEGAIESTWVPQEGKPDRRVYRITSEGLNGLAEKQKEWRRFQDGVGRIVLGLEGNRG